MGISIAYRGKLRDPALVPELVGDLAAKAESAGWLSKTMKELVAEKRVTCSGLEGITLYPHRECEPLHFHFDEEGTFTNHYYHALLSDTEMANMMREALAESAALTRNLARSTQSSQAGAGPRITVPDLPEAPGVEFFKQGSRYNWTKTQFAGPKVHVAVCAILRYVKERYAPDLEVKDDSGYFASGDYAKLEAGLAHVERLASITTDAIQAAATSSKGPMTLDEFVNRINEEIAEARNRLH
ncbi:hypothetical protein SOCEGT47_072420 [Sorangium cellulosum]|jgi:hypothetical protein|uniref:Uncharacterized protein n=1 Tax=Sorangium cellulosum TaxID=56 RepID=A0A4V0NEM3_SORCE|nr:hypothetical protein [Sorangium cellulosum]AUX26672.1 hypothetical protein SOCEGT47_072420 [Sorangium cellulosum]